MPTEAFARSADAFNGVVVAPRPFEADAVALHAMPEGWTIAQMVERLEADGALDPAVRPWLRVVLNDRMLTAAEWSAVPAIGDALVIEVAAMARSNPVRTLLQIAVIAMAVFVGGAMLSGLTGALATAAITVGGTMLINAIAPIKQPDVARRQERYSLDGGSNAAAPHEAMPIVLGRRRIYPRRCANWYTRTVNNVVYLRMMFQPSVGWVDHASPRLGETDVASYEGVTLRWRTRPDEGIEPAYFGDVTPLEQGWGVPITNAAGWLTRSFPMEADTLSMDVSFMAGLYEAKESSGNPKNRSVTFEFRYGPKGGDPASATPCPWTTGGQKTWTRDKLDAWREGFSWNVPRGEYDMHMRRITADPGNTARISDELTLVCLRAFRNEAAVADLTGKPWIEMEIQASEQLSGVPQDFNFVATSIVPQATAAGPGALIATRNPADLYLAASYPPFSDVELDDDERNFAAIAAWRATCVAEGWNCDLAESGELSVGELLQRIAAMGRARPTLDFGALSVVVDWDKPLPRQMFTPRNVSGFVGELNYAEEIHALRLRFQNEAKDYDDDIAVVFAPGYDINTATLYSSIEVRDKSNLEEVEREGVRLLAEPRLRPETFTFEQDWESLAIGEGDRAYLAHHVALVGEVSGRVAAQVADLDWVGRKGLRLDELVVMEAGRSYDLAWRPSADAPIVVLALDTIVGQDDHVWFPLPAPANLPQPGDLVTVFEHAVELLDVVVNRISPAEGLKAEIECVPYAPELQSLVEGEIPAYRTAASRPGGLASASIVRRTPRAVEQVLEQIGGAVEEAGKGVEQLNEVATGLGDGVASLGIALEAVEVTAQAASIGAGQALALLQTPGTGVIQRLTDVEAQADGADARLTDEIALRTAENAAAVARIGDLEASRRVVANALRNGNAADPQALRYWTAPSGGFVVGNDPRYGTYFGAVANTSGATRILLSEIHATSPGDVWSLGLEGDPGGSSGSARAFAFFTWTRAGVQLGNSAAVFLDNGLMSWTKRAEREGVTVPATVAGQVPDGFQICYAVPDGHLNSTFSNVMVNQGEVALPFNDLSTARSSLARTASLELAQAATDGSLAVLTDRVGVSMQQGDSIVTNARFGAYTAAAGIPDGWSEYLNGAAATRQPAPGGRYAPRWSTTATQMYGIVQSVTLTPGDWILEFQAMVTAGDWRGCGLLASYPGGEIGRIDCGIDPDNGGVTGAGVPGYRRFTKRVTVPSPVVVTFYAMATWDGYASGRSAKTIDIQVADVYPVDAAVRAAQADASTALTAYSTLSASFSSYQTTTDARFTSPTGEVQVAKSQAVAQSLADTNQAISTYDASTTASFGGLRAATGALQTSLTTLSNSFASYQTTTEARFTGPTGEVQVAKSQAIAQSLADTNQAISTYDASTSASFGGLRAATGLLQSAMTTVQGRVVAWLKLTASSGSEEAKVEVVADEGGSLIRMVAKAISLANTVGGVVVDVLKIVGGEVFFGAPVSIDVAGKRLTLGPGFGSSSDLVWWFGPSAISVAAMTKVNGHFALATDGKVYYGTAELGTGSGNPDAVTGRYGQQSNLAPNSGTHALAVQLDLSGVAASDLVEAKFLITQEVTGALSTTGTWSGGWEIVEQTTAGGSTAVRASGLLTIEDSGGGLLDIQSSEPMDAFMRLPGRTLNGTVRYALRLWRDSGPTITGNGIHAELRVQRTP